MVGSEVFCGVIFKNGVHYFPQAMAKEVVNGRSVCYTDVRLQSPLSFICSLDHHGGVYETHAVCTNLALFSGMHLAKGRKVMYIHGWLN